MMKKLLFISLSIVSLFANNDRKILDKQIDGDYYTVDGRYLGTDSINDNKVYVASYVDSTKTGMERFVNAQDLYLPHSSFATASNVILHESIKGDKLEVLYIAHTAYNRSKELGLDIYSLLMSGYSSVPSSFKREVWKQDTSYGVCNARSAVIDVALGNPDPTNGATFWDGTDFLAWGLKSPNGTPQNKFEEYSFIQMDLDVFFQYLYAHQLKYPREIVKYRGREFKFPQDVFLNSENWNNDVFHYKTKASEPLGIVATVTAGLSIFWKTVKIE